jgi:putative tryptophan/tyrosine transport system substrate-binding protein
MRRRQFVAVAVFGAAAGWSFAAHAQQSRGLRRVGVLMEYPRDDREGQARVATLVKGLDALNWRESVNLQVDWRWTGGDYALYEQHAAELVSLGPEVIVAAGSLSVEAVRRHTSKIPIVFLNVTDPVGQGFVKTLSHPGGNITGFSVYDPPMAGKWLETLTQISPPVARVAVLFNPETPYARLYLRAIEEASAALPLTAQPAPCRDGSELAAMMAALGREDRGGFLALPSIFTDKHRDQIVALAAQHRLPAVYPYRFFAAIGGLMSYGIDQADLYRRTPAYVDRILKGDKPADLPVQSPTKFELVINMNTAKRLGLTIPPALLTRADEAIE